MPKRKKQARKGKNRQPNLIYLQRAYAKKGSVYLAYSAKSGRVREVAKGKDMDKFMDKVKERWGKGEDLVITFVPQYRKTHIYSGGT